ncbi:hypothetical protein NLJ89_g5228 [Agrocybe chaxingu]|uniref:Uncharacterized protein n=1 Tax=Agrocybe chaxingu TaxID=84603 RepID=A0A9W8K1I8_9AGAR|nr:hypothetical protein NLJ89_g5228 [Agrocybe chaxingu]
MDSPEGLRLRLMTLLSLYDLLPYSISNPPNGSPPLTLEQAIGPDAVRRCLEAIANQRPETLPATLAAILGNSSRSNNRGSSKSTPRGYYSAGTSYPANYSA